MNAGRNGKPVAWMAAGVLFAGSMAWVFFANMRTPEATAPAPSSRIDVKPEVRFRPAPEPSSENGASRKEAEIKRRELQILAKLRANTPVDINNAYFKLVPALIALDPVAAAKWAQGQTNPQWREDLMMVVAQSWAGLDPDAAQQWTANLQNPAGKPRERDNMVSYVAFEVAKTDPVRAVQVLRETEIDPERREVVVQNLATQLADRRAITPLTDWLRTLPAGDGRDQLLARVAAAQAQSDPAGAANLVSAYIQPGPTQEQAARDVVRLWAFSDAASAQQWVDRFPHDAEVFSLATETLKETMDRRSGTTPSAVGSKSAE